MATPVNPKYPLFLRDIDKEGSSFSTVVVEDNFNIDAKPGIFYDIKNKENDEININLEDNNNNQFLINCPCSLSFNKDIDWVNNDLPNLNGYIKIFIRIQNNIALFDYIISYTNIKDNIIYYKSDIKPEINKGNEFYSANNNYYKGFGIISGINKFTTISNIFDDPADSVKEIILPNSITHINNHAFYNCINLSKINIPNNVKHIDGNNFNKLNKLDYIIDTSQNHYYDNCLVKPWIYGIVKLIEGVKLICGSDSIDTGFDIYKEIIEFTCPESLRYISNNAIRRCLALETLNLNEGLLEIGDNNFCNNYNYYNDTDNYPYTAQYLTNVTIPSTLRRIGNNCFTDTPFINNLPNGEIYFGKVFYKYNSDKTTIKDLIIKEGTVSIQANALLNTNTDSIINIILPETLEHIGDYAFNNCFNVENIVIPNNVTELSRYAFVYCTGLKTITTAKGTYNIDEYTYAIDIQLANGQFVNLILNEEMHECVLPETEILINNQGDTKQIKDLQIGDKVITNKDNTLIETTINKLVQVQHNSYLKVTLENNDILNISLDHNICTKDGWKCYNNTISKNKECIGKLTIGDEVLTTNGFINIVSIEMINKYNTIMYNIGVKEGNNYYANNICIYECDK